MRSRCSPSLRDRLVLKVIVLSIGLYIGGAAIGQGAFADGTNQLTPVAFPQDIPSSDPDGSPQPLPSLADMLERVNPAVVNIATRSVVRESNRLLEDPFFRRFFNVPKVASAIAARKARARVWSSMRQRATSLPMPTS